MIRNLWRPCVVGILIHFALSGLSASHAAATDYTLGSQDKLRIRVVEWDIIEGEMREWPAIGGDYSVDAVGRVLMPFIGAIEVDGISASELAALIGDKLQERFGLSTRPEASVELIEYRPVFVSGDVESPGRYPFVPGLSVIKAVSVAGGVRSGEIGSRAERDVISAKGNMEILVDQRNRLLVRRERLKAEAEGRTEFDASEAGSADMIIAEERAIMNARQTKLRLQLENLENLKELFRKEIESLHEKNRNQQRQVELARGELESIGSLVEKGLIRNNRVLSSERLIADLESGILDNETAILRARQSIAEAEQDAISLQNTVRSDISIERREVEAALAENRVRMRMFQGLMAEALPMAALSADDAFETVYRLVRSVDGETVEMVVDDYEAMRPGDVLRVETLIRPELVVGQ